MDKIKGQISVWDIEVSKIKVPDINIHAKNNNSFTEIIDKNILNRYINEANKIIKAYGGRYIIQLNNESIHLTKKGEIDFKSKNITPILPMDKILYAKYDEEINEIQKEALGKVKKEFDVKNVVKRYGDKNYIVILENKTLSINENGWVLEFESKAIYKEDEIIKEKPIEIGDTVKVEYEGIEYIGKVMSIYGPDKGTFNIIFNNKHTAFYKNNVKLVC